MGEKQLFFKSHQIINQISMGKSLFSLLILCLSVAIVSAQNLYLPRNIKAAIAKGTRTENGLPGSNYWQNKGVYNINIKVVPETKMVSGIETIIYTNNSPDTLHQIAIRFVNNIHKPEAPRSGYSLKNFLTDGLQIHSLTIDDNVYAVNSNGWGTVAMLRLKKRILPKTNATLKIEWSYPLSKESGREGQIDSNTFYCAYSYPRVSVYDDYNSWDMIPHTDGQEFYNDFNDYDLKVSVPKNWIVWGTGVLQNADEVLNGDALKRFNQSLISDQTIHIATADQMKRGEITAQNNWNTWRFVANNISDMCFATSNHYRWDAASVIVDTATHRRASMQAAYTERAKDFEQYVDWGKYCLNWFSTQWPGVAYPYSTMTAIQGFADMEYPMMVNDASLEDLKDSRLTLDHEVAHTYFPFFMGINETRYAFMDEGWATTFEYLIGIAENGKPYADSAYKAMRVARYINNPAAEEDQPIITQSTQVSGVGYGHNSYGKASLSYLALKDLLGDDLFKKALHYYMDIWKGKHPIPWDFFNCINKGAGQNLNWFFENWFFTNYYLDLKISQVNATTVQIENVGGFAIPFDVKTVLANGKEVTAHYSPAVWRGTNRINIKTTSNQNIKSVTIDNGVFLDATPNDNSIVL